MEDMDRPEWASLSKTVWFDGDSIKAIGYAEGNPKSNISALAQIADNNGKSEILRLINNKVGTIVQNVQKGDVVDNRNFEFYGSEEVVENVRKLLSKNRYYELVSTENGTEVPDMKIEFYSLIEIKKSDFTKAVQESLWKKNDAKKSLDSQLENSLNNVIGDS
jgi:hypothetical protein